MKSLLETTLGKYKLLSITEENSCYVTFDAIDLEENRKKIVKIFQSFYAKEEKEKQVLYSKLTFVSKLKHPNLIVPEEMGYEKDFFYVGFPFVERNLAAVCEKSGAITTANAIKVIQQVADCLQYVHNNNVLHLNITPFSIFMLEDSNIQLSGLGFIPAKEFFLRSDVLDCPFYASPELILQQKISPVVDLYSLGISMFHVLTGKLPFEGNTTEEIFQRILYAEIPRLTKYRPNIFPELDDLIYRLMTRDTQEKIVSASQLVEMVNSIAKEKNIKIKSPQDAENTFISLLQKNPGQIEQIISIFETLAKQQTGPTEVRSLMEKIAIQEISEKLNCNPKSIKTIKDCPPLIQNPREWIKMKLVAAKQKKLSDENHNIPKISPQDNQKIENPAPLPSNTNAQKSNVIKSRAGEYMSVVDHTAQPESNIIKTKNSGDYMKMFSTPLNTSRKESSLTRRNQSVDFETFRQEKEKKQTTSIKLDTLAKKSLKETSHFVVNPELKEAKNNIMQESVTKEETKKPSFIMFVLKRIFRFIALLIFTLIIVLSVYIFLSPELQEQIKNWYFSK